MIYFVLDSSLFRQPFCVFVAILDHKLLNTGARCLRAGATLGSSSYGVQSPSPFIVLTGVVWILLSELALLFLVGFSSGGVTPVVDHGVVAANQLPQLTIGPAVLSQSSDRLLSLLWVTLGHTTAYHKKGPLGGPRIRPQSCQAIEKPAETFPLRSDPTDPQQACRWHQYHRSRYQLHYPWRP